MHIDLANNAISESTQDRASQIIESCVHCGFCLATCPTYQLLGDELDSPRGRIYLIKSALEKNQFSQKSLSHMDRCLTCRSCETTCPSGVEYGQLLEIGREMMESKRGKLQALYRYIVRKTLLTPLLFRPIGYFLRHSKVSSKPIKPNTIDSSVLLMGGCVQPSLAPNINHSIKNILAKLNIEVRESSQSECCGALDQHLAASNDALKKVKRNIDTWISQLDSGVEAIISSASGCGVMIKDYPNLFEESDSYYEKALLVSSKTKDIAEFLANKDLSMLNLKELNISYHEPCTMQHGQKLGGLVESILSDFGYIKKTVKDSHICCGSAGTYSIFETKIANQLRSEKIENLNASKPKMIVTSNIGCLMHLQKGSSIPVKHWVELLDV
ncbi:glycolate oxidase subunit GlcF [Candidatus Pseudothioglobus singularis]|jgi:glycolate oxidase iron-sulfur subunit|nr:glycolate oxidase subunit GlcF [Candidatus Pseudothioglobus singularis]